MRNEAQYGPHPWTWEQLDADLAQRMTIEVIREIRQPSPAFAWIPDELGAGLLSEPDGGAYEKATLRVHDVLVNPGVELEDLKQQRAAILEAFNEMANILIIQGRLADAHRNGDTMLARQILADAPMLSEQARAIELLDYQIRSVHHDSRLRVAVDPVLRVIRSTSTLKNRPFRRRTVERFVEQEIAR